MRAKALEFATNRFHQLCGGTRNQIISVGCGFDSGYFRLKAQGLLVNSCYIEVQLKCSSKHLGLQYFFNL